MSYGNYPDLSQMRRALIIKMRHHGDVLLTSPVFSALKAAFPQMEIDALVYKDTLPMLEGHPDISNFLFYDRNWKKLPVFKKLRNEWALLKAVRTGGYDLVINLTEGDRGAIAAIVSGSRVRVGFDPEGQGFRGKRKCYTHLVKPCHQPRHTVEKQLDALRRIGIFPAFEERDLTLALSDDAKQRALMHLEEVGLENQDFFVVHAVSRWRFKCPPPQKIAAVLDAMTARGAQVLLTSGPDPQEIAFIEEILKRTASPVATLAGKTSLKELGALISLAKGVVCVDSVPLHMASALKTPVVVLFGPSSEKNWGPWMHSQARIVTQPLPCRPCFRDGCGGSKMSDCLWTMPVSLVIDAIEDLALLQRLERITVSKN